jgi:GTP-binding GTPase N-terminal
VGRQLQAHLGPTGERLESHAHIFHVLGQGRLGLVALENDAARGNDRTIAEKYRCSPGGRPRRLHHQPYEHEPADRARTHHQLLVLQIVHASSVTRPLSAVESHRWRRPSRPSRPAKQARRLPLATLIDVDVVLIGYFSTKEKEYAALMDGFARLIEARGARVVGRFVQRRGVSHGGVDKMNLPLSSRTLFGAGKVREIADAREAANAGAVISFNALTDHQRGVLEQIFGCPIIDRDELDP